MAGCHVNRKRSPWLALSLKKLHSRVLPKVVGRTFAQRGCRQYVQPRCLARFVVAAFGEGWCFLIDGVSYFAVIASLLDRVRCYSRLFEITQLPQALLQSQQLKITFPEKRLGRTAAVVKESLSSHHARPAHFDELIQCLTPLKALRWFIGFVRQQLLDQL